MEYREVKCGEGSTGSYSYSMDQVNSTWPSPLITYSLDAYVGTINLCPIDDASCLVSYTCSFTTTEAESAEAQAGMEGLCDVVIGLAQGQFAPK